MNTIQKLINHKDEGFFSLWKGTLIYWYKISIKNIIYFFKNRFSISKSLNIKNINFITGHFSNWIYEMLHVLIQPSIEGIINRTFDLYDETLPLIQMDKVLPNLTSLVVSYTITGFLLSPIELVRIR